MIEVIGESERELEFIRLKSTKHEKNKLVLDSTKMKAAGPNSWLLESRTPGGGHGTLKFSNQEDHLAMFSLITPDGKEWPLPFVLEQRQNVLTRGVPEELS